jgi:putative ABC transport system permease protein
VFSSVDAVLVRPLPYADPDRLVAVWIRNMKEMGPSKLFDGYEDFEEYGRSAGSFSSVAAAMWAIDAQVLTGRGPTRDLSRGLAYPRFRAMLFGAFAVSALLLAAVGVYGVLGQFIAQRRHEFAVRVAIGASKHDIALLVTRHGGVPVIVGLIAGAAAALVSKRALEGLLYGVGRVEPLTIGGILAILLAVAAVSMAIPARRAATIDPMAALREE